MKSRIINFFTFFTYRRKLSLAFLSLLILPMLTVSYLLIQMNVRENESQLLNYYTSTTERDMESVTAIFNTAMIRLNTIDQDSRLHVYLNSVENDLVRLVEISFYFHSLYQSLVFGEAGMDVNIYRSTQHFLPEGFVKHIDKLDPSILDECLRLSQGDILIQNNNGQMHFLKLHRRGNQPDYLIFEVTIPFERVKSVFNSDRQQNDLAAIYRPRDGEDVLLSGNENFSFKNCYLFEYTINQASWIFYHDQEISFHRDASELYPVASNYGKVIFYVENSPIYSGIPLTIFLLIGLFCSVVILVLYISRRLTNRLYSVIDQIRHRYDAGDARRIELQYTRNDEFHIITEKLNELIDTVDTYYEDIKNISIENKELETQLLQDLISPHFLYNTLDGIKWLCNEQKVTEVVDTMIDYYRASLNKGMLYLIIAAEIKNVCEYMKLQQFAYESGFRYFLDIDPEITELYTIKHILQPFVENAILHGIDKTGENGFIKIKGYKENGSVFLEIEDNGCGIKKEELDKMYDKTDGIIKGGYGIMNVHKRIVNLFGPGYGIQIRSEEGAGTKVSIKIPVKETPVS